MKTMKKIFDQLFWEKHSVVNDDIRDCDWLSLFIYGKQEVMSVRERKGKLYSLPYRR